MLKNKTMNKQYITSRNKDVESRYHTSLKSAIVDPCFGFLTALQRSRMIHSFNHRLFLAK